MRGHVELADGVHQLTVQTRINVIVLRDDDGVTLIDTGLDRPGLTTRLARLGIAPSEVTRVLLTHAHPDHAGGVRRLRRHGSTASVSIGADDLEVGRGVAQPPTPEHLGGRLLSRLPQPGPWGRAVAVPDATALEDGARLPIAGGLEVVATPGHTVGHVAFHLPARDVVIGGDVVFNVFSLRPSPAFLCWRTAPNLDSVGRLAALGAGTLALAHGRPVTDDVAGRLSQLVTDR
ncbi:MAG: MBL fold metallo-hydrolase [Nitriliruptor sp.]|nr:MAG: MBL fold metallo-hydrolase [Nitriliruptor sp.]